MNDVLQGRTPDATPTESRRFMLGIVLPHYLQGVFIRRPFWVGLFARLRSGPMASHLGSKLREKYNSKGVFIRLGRARSLMLFDQAEIERVLKRSPSVYADPPGKRRGMSHFQPAAVTISRGDEWRERREFNERVLHAEDKLHPSAAIILRVVREETERCVSAREDLRWRNFEELFERITLRVVFGRAEEAEREVAELLARLMRQANRGFLLRQNRLYARYRSALERGIQTAVEDSLAARCSEANAERRIPVPAQVTHWLFAMNDTLAENVVRALGVTESCPQIDTQARRELEGKNLQDPAHVSGLAYLEGCVQEAMRLWPSTPLIVREAIAQDTLCGATVSPGTQIVIPNLFHHVDRGVVDRPWEFVPDRWLGDQPRDWFYHFGGGSQACPGANLALFIAKGVLSCLLELAHYEVRRPRIESQTRMPRSYNPFAIRLRRTSARSL
ncbi:MAG: cytochrome P450 [Acidiferrobacterales bacterium]